MVQISRSTLQQQSSRTAAGIGERGGGDRGESSLSSTIRGHHRGALFRRGLFGLLRFLFMSAFIPSLFIIRYYWFSDDRSYINIIPDYHTPKTFESSSSSSSKTSTASKVGVIGNIGGTSGTAGTGGTAAAAAGDGGGGAGSIRSRGSNGGGDGGGQQQQQQTEQTQNKAAAAALEAEEELQQRTKMFAFLNEIDFSSKQQQQQQHRALLVESDIVQLDHCRIQDVNIHNFTTWAFSLVNDSVTQLLLQYQKAGAASPPSSPNDDDNNEDDDNDNNASPVVSWNKMTIVQQQELRIAMQQEFVLELLEMYAHHAGYCDFSSIAYHPTVPNDDTGFTQRAVTRLRASEKQYANTANNKNGKRKVVRDTDDDAENEQNENKQQQEQQQLRLVISIMAFKDVDQLKRLVQAVHMPQHYIIIHVEQRASLQFVQAIQREILDNDNNDNEMFSNVVLLQFGTIVYRTDSVSMTNLRIMRWITLDLQLDYDYYVTLDGSSFPLQQAQDLHSALLLRSLSEENNDKQEGGVLRFLDQEAASSNNNNNNGQETDDDGASLGTDSLQQAHDVLTTNDITTIDDEIETDPATTIEDGGSGASVWLGSLLHKGVAVDSPQWHLLLQKRLVFTRNNNNMADRDASTTPLAAAAALSYPKLHKRLPRSVFKTAAAAASSSSLLPKNVLVPSEIIRSHMTKKSISGNQGIFRRNVVQQLLTSPDVMELFALSKYACCCCVEERNWIAALGIISQKNSDDNTDDSLKQQEQQQPGRSDSINYQQEALRQSSTFELWGGEGTECVSSMKNAVLTRNTSVCYKIDDQILVQAATGSATAPTIANTTSSSSPPSQHYFYGNETWSYLKLAKSKGYFFARKFDSSQPQSMDLLNDIQLELWEEA